MKKININVDEVLLAEIDDSADKKHMTRTAYMLNAVQERIAADRFLESQPDIMKKMTELQQALSRVAVDTDNNDSI